MSADDQGKKNPHREPVTGRGRDKSIPGQTAASTLTTFPTISSGASTVYSATPGSSRPCKRPDVLLEPFACIWVHLLASSHNIPLHYHLQIHHQRTHLITSNPVPSAPSTIHKTDKDPAPNAISSDPPSRRCERCGEYCITTPSRSIPNPGLSHRQLLLSLPKLDDVLIASKP
jgi:hypothetical protein